MRTRLLSVAVLLPVALVALLLGGWFYNGLIAILLLIGSAEYCGMLKQSRHQPTVILVALTALTWHLDVWLKSQRIQAFAFAGVVLVTVIWALYRYQTTAPANSDKGQLFTEDWALVVAGGVYLGLGTRSLLRLRTLTLGAGWTLITLFIVWISDTTAYFVGRAWGEHKIAPAISPGKSWEGYVAQVISGVVSGGVMVALWPLVVREPVNVPVWQGVALGAVVSAVSPLGDFFISMIKRETGVKDTSRLIPGHGGVLDRLDTPLWAGILAHMFLTFIR